MAKKKTSPGAVAKGSRAGRRAPERAAKGKPLVRTVGVAEATVGVGAAATPRALVCIGASAGGLEAILDVLPGIPDTSGLSIVYVQHLDPRHPSMLVHLLSSKSHLPVAEVVDGDVLRPDRIYVIPPNAALSLDGEGRVRVTPRRQAGHGTHNPIDEFMTALAQHAGPRAVGVVLSGTASDGAIGMREIKAAGGITIAQEPRTAKYDAMPRAAIGMDVVDLVLPPMGIAQELRRLASAPLSERVGVEGEQPVENHFHRVLMALRTATGVDFTHYKQPTIRRRLQRRMVLRKTGTVGDYLKLIHQDAAEVTALFQDILIHVTRFFRDPETFETLREKVFRAVTERRLPDVPLRIWVPGCSTGEEAYSVAIALVEFLGETAAAVPVQIFATDVADAAVERARMGIYPETIAADVSPERLRRFFNRVDGSYRVTKQVRDMCVFARQDLTRDPPFSKLDLIICRNVLIYLDVVLQKKLMTVFHYALKPGGFLMLGGAETVGTHADLFTVADKRHRLYVRKQSVARSDMQFPHVEYSGPVGVGASRVELPRKFVTDSRTGANVQNEANRVTLARFAPPGVIVDSENRIVQFRGQTGPFLEPAPGEASLNLLKMAREGLLHALRTAIREAAKKNAPVRKGDLRVKANGHIEDVGIEVIPLDGAAEERHFLVLFEQGSRGASAETVAPAKGKQTTKAAASPRDVEHLRALQQELAASREYLQSIIQDLEAANEELQSANEEILSSNEELQSTNEELDTAKEELQSTNEELNTVNEELQARNEELSRVNSDLINLLASVQIAIVMVSSDLRIRRFTPMAERVLNLIPTDVGRPISHIKPNIECDHLEKLITESIDAVTIKELQVKDRTGSWYSLRIRPYKNVENRIDGAVLALVDLGTNIRTPAGAKKAAGPGQPAGRDHDGQDAHAVPRAMVDSILQTVLQPVAVLNTDYTVSTANEAFVRLFAAGVGQVVGRSIYEVADGMWDAEAMRELFDRALPSRGTVDGLELPIQTPDGVRRTYKASARRISTGPDGRTTAAVVLSLRES